MARLRRPGILVSVGYMDPGNWGTDLQGGAQFKYGLLWVVGLASLMAIFMQVISARLGVVTGKDLAQCCRDWYPALDPLAQLAHERTRHRRLRPGRSPGQRRRSQPAVPHPPALGRHHHRPRRAAAAGPAALRHAHHRSRRPGADRDHRRLLLHRDFRPSADAAQLPGDGTGPHHAASSRTRACSTSRSASSARPSCPTTSTCTPRWCRAASCKKTSHPSARAIRFNTIDSIVALTIAFFVNAAILVLAAMVFFGKSGVAVPGGTLRPLQRRQRLDPRRLPDPGPACSARLPPAPLFAVALLASGQSSTITGTLAGQVVMEGFMHWRIRPWVRRLITRDARHPARRLHHRHPRQQQRHRSADPQPGGARAATSVRHVPPAAFHQLPQAHGHLEEWLVSAGRRLGQCYPDHRHGHLRPALTP